MSTFAALWRAAVDQHADRLFLSFDSLDGTCAEWSYGAFDDLVEEVAVRLEELGAGRGEHRGVHLVHANSPAFLATWLAALRIGAPLVPSDPRSSDRELVEHAKRTAPAVAVVTPDRQGAYSAALQRVHVLAVREDDVTLTALRSRARGVAPRTAPRPLDHAATMFTSGTTSAPKGVVLTQAGYAWAGRTMAQAAELVPEDRCLVVLPLFHANAQYYSCAAAIAAGASVVLLGRFSAGGFVRSAREHEATHASLFAAPMRMILARTSSDEPPARLRHCWFAQDITAQQHDALSRLLGCRPRQLYGMTETLPAVLTTPSSQARADAMGAPTAGCVVDLIDPGTGEPVAPGTVGELAIGGRRGIELFAGYLDDPATTEAAFVDGRFRTSDLARMHPDGLLRFVGRRNDVLKVAGENVSAVEVEAVLAEHPDVEDVAVVGAPDVVRDEVPVAHVVGKTTHAALEAWCAERLAPSKRPRDFVFHAALPRTSVGKIRKHELRAGAGGSL